MRARIYVIVELCRGSSRGLDHSQRGGGFALRMVTYGAPALPALQLQLMLMLLAAAAVVKGYHSPLTENKNVHCWPLGANEQNDEVIDCKGLNMVWNGKPPPTLALQGEKFTLSVNVTANETFFMKENFGNGSGSVDLQQFCREDCEDCHDLTGPEDCCVWHANVHICHSIAHFCGEEPPCGPWVGNNSVIATQTHALCGPLGTYTHEVYMDVLGRNVIIFHMLIGNMQIVLGTNMFIISKTCGDGKCQAMETCDSCGDTPQILDDLDNGCIECPEDCCLVAFAIILGSTGAIIVIIIAVMVLGTCLAIVICVVHRKRKRMLDESWVISYSDIKINPQQMRYSSLGSLRRTRDNSSMYSSTQDLNKQIFTEIGTYKSCAVAIRRVRSIRGSVSSSGVIHPKFRKEVVQIRVLDHKNLCKFIGVTVKDPVPNIAIISEYCPKGSLTDVLQNDEIPLNWHFRFSFAGDIARGMAYMHSHGLSHGRLTSSNCVIDDRWVTKITDYGLPSLRQQGPGGQWSEQQEERKAIPKVYKAPEVRSRDLSADHGSTLIPADVYSYAIILFEIATRIDPSSDDMQLDANWKPKVKLKQLSETECPCPQEYFELINRCWTFSPLSRLTFDKVKRTLHCINPSHSSPVDNMMIMLEKYSKHLEQQVEKRTEELMVEKERTTNLLYRMIPPAVAEELKHGKTVPATSFNGATIFFSDIVGFTTLAGSSTPMQIVNLLNTLYSEFDEILDQFDVYKVETIGDAYMVVSGVPQANGDSHAGEIAKMALRLMGTCKTFKIPHMPDSKLEIRAGIHSGSVCAGVVGTKMPRYCLFGDTVNTASRMESNSIAMHIQCSEATYQLLTQLGGFSLESRGPIEIKGKGTMTTWWLVDYTEPEKPPLLPPRADIPISPTTKEPIRQPPKKSTSSVGASNDVPLQFRRSSVNLSRDPSYTNIAALETSYGSAGGTAFPPGLRAAGNGGGLVFQRNQSLQITRSFSNLLAEGGGNSKRMLDTRQSIDVGVLQSNSATELSQANFKTLAGIARNPPPTGARHSIPNPQIKLSISGRAGELKLAHHCVQSVGHGAPTKEPAKHGTTGSPVWQLPGTPLDD